MSFRSQAWGTKPVTLRFLAFTGGHYKKYMAYLWHVKGFPGGTSSKEPACQCRRHKRRGSIPGSGRSPAGGHGDPLQYFFFFLLRRYTSFLAIFNFCCCVGNSVQLWCAGPSLQRPPQLWGTDRHMGSAGVAQGPQRAGSVAMAHGHSRSAARGTLLDRG